MVWYGMVWYGMVWYGVVWYGMVWYGMVWYGMVWYGMVWHGVVWSGMLLLLMLLRRSARAGGRNCQTRSPWAERKGAVGRRNAGRAGADDDRGGGGGVPPSVRGGGGRVSLREGLPVRVTHAPSPTAGGGYAHLCETDAGWGLVGGTTCPGTCGAPAPLAAPTPPLQGRGRSSSAKVEEGGRVGGVCMVYTPVSRFPCVWSARDALWAAVAGSGDLAARGSALGPAGVVPPAGVACHMG